MCYLWYHDEHHLTGRPIKLIKYVCRCFGVFYFIWTCLHCLIKICSSSNLCAFLDLFLSLSLARSSLSFLCHCCRSETWPVDTTLLHSSLPVALCHTVPRLLFNVIRPSPPATPPFFCSILHLEPWWSKTQSYSATGHTRTMEVSLLLISSLSPSSWFKDLVGDRTSPNLVLTSVLYSHWW